MDKDKPNKEMMLLDTYEDEGTPQEVKDWEQKCLQEEKNKEKDLKEKDNEQKNLCINDNADEKETKITTIPENETKEFKEFKTNRLVLNSYWILLVSKICFTFSILIYEIIGCIILISLSDLFQNNIMTSIDAILFMSNLGIRWLFIISVSQHLSIGFFCLTNFTDILKETNEIIPFFVSVIVKNVIFYLLSILIMKGLIEKTIFKAIVKEINKLKLPQELNELVFEVVNDVKKISLRYMGNLLGNFNNNLDKLLMGTLYITLFSSPKFIKDKYLLYFRFLSIFPILYIALSLIIRALNNLGKITLSPYLSPLFVGPKFTIFGFFVYLLFYIKIKKRKYKMYDEENNIMPSVFAKISSKIFAIFGFIELFTGLFFPEFSKYGIGQNYLIIICAPIMTLYDYKKKYELHIKPCKKRNIGKCINISYSIFI